MYNELRQELERVLLSQELVAALQVAPCALNFQIEEPTDRQFGLLASNLSFVYSKKLKERSGVVISPQIVAEKIAKLVPTNHFKISVDGGGFLNVNPTKDFIKNYLSSKPVTIDFEIPVNWHSNSMLEKIRFSQEATFFLKELSKQRTELSRSDSLQLLSILGDIEISSSAYLRGYGGVGGYGGRDNTPSYLSNFEKVVTTLPAPTGELERLELVPFVEKLILFRGRLEESFSRDHPERIMELILKVVRDFFSYYNRPTIRRQIMEGTNPDFLFFAASCGKQVLMALNAIKFSCQLPVTVL